MDKIRVFTAFSGYDSQCLALDRLKSSFPNFDYDLVGWSEIDKYAIQAHNALFPQWAERNYGDISKIDWSQVPDFDLFTYSSPCQDFSNAGLQRGGEEGSGTRSSLLWECRKAIIAKRPKYLILENVKALVSKKFLPTFNKWIQDLEDYGYYNTWQVLNAKDYGVPQNRERVFLISIRRDLLDPDPSYYFPKPFPLQDRLKDVLEENVDEKYYLSDKKIDYMKRTSSGGIQHGKGIRTLNDETCGTIMAVAQLKTGGGSGIIKGRLVILKPREIYGLSRSRDKQGKVVKRSLNDYVNCLHTQVGSARDNMEVYVMETNTKMRIRKLTPRECFRLMGVDDADIGKIQASGISNSQQYKCAGNSIVVDVLYHLFRKMFVEKGSEEATYQQVLF